MTLEQIFYLSQSVASVAVVGSRRFILGCRCAAQNAMSARSCNKGGPTAPLTVRWLLQARNSRASFKKAWRETRRLAVMNSLNG